jgi:DNA repair protein RadC
MPQTNRLTMKTIPCDDRPTEKLCRRGPSALTDAELLAVIVRSGTARENVLTVCQHLLSPTDDLAKTRGETNPVAQGRPAPGGLRTLLDMSLEELQSHRGIGAVRAAQIKAALELGSRLVICGSQENRKAIKSPEDVMALLAAEMQFLPFEEFRAVLLDSRNRMIRICRLSQGTLNASVVHPRDLFREAVKSNAAAVILAHNHPSGDSTPSNDDVQTTKHFIELGQMMGVRVVDHLIIAHNGSASLHKLGLI